MMQYFLLRLLIIQAVIGIYAILANAELEKKIAYHQKLIDEYKAFLAPFHREWDEMPDDWMLEEVAK